MKEDAADFKIDRVPVHSGWIHQFTLHALQTKNNSEDVMYFAYPVDEGSCAKSVTRQLLLTNIHCFPRDFFYASSIYQSHYRKISLLNRGSPLSYGITLADDRTCCGQAVEEHFFANVSLPRE